MWHATTGSPIRSTFPPVADGEFVGAWSDQVQAGYSLTDLCYVLTAMTASTLQQGVQFQVNSMTYDWYGGGHIGFGTDPQQIYPQFGAVNTEVLTSVSVQCPRDKQYMAYGITQAAGDVWTWFINTPGYPELRLNGVVRVTLQTQTSLPDGIYATYPALCVVAWQAVAYTLRWGDRTGTPFSAPSGDRSAAAAAVFLVPFASLQAWHPPFFPRFADGECVHPFCPTADLATWRAHSRVHPLAPGGGRAAPRARVRESRFRDVGYVRAHARVRRSGLPRSDARGRAL